MQQPTDVDDKSWKADAYSGPAAAFNQRVLRKLQRALERQPDIDLRSALPRNYEFTLATKKEQQPQSRIHVVKEPVGNDQQSPEASPKPLPTVDLTIPASVVYPLSDAVKSLLDCQGLKWTNDGKFLSYTVARLLQSVTMIFQSTTDYDHYVARCSDDLMIKAISKPDSTEYTALQFLASERPGFPAPAPHGVIAVGDIWYMFLTFIPGASLDTVWPDLAEEQKRAISNDLDEMLLGLRSLPYDNERALGGVGGEGCKDTRRHTRIAESPLYTCDDVWDFMFGQPRNKGTVYARFLHNLTFPPRRQRVVFIHGDVRPANIIVQPHPDGTVKIQGMIDWEKSGFYPEDLECVKAMNNLSPIGDDDWYLYLPPCISPKNHLESWLAD